MEVPNLNSNIFIKISKLINENIGVNLTHQKKEMVRSRLLGRLNILNFTNFEDYYKYLINNSDELIFLYNLLTTNLTSFFREKYHFQFLEEFILPELKNKKNKSIKVWSAGCSSGQEAYSLAIILREFFLSNWEIKILATDINTEVLDMAQKGIYSFKEVKNIPYELLKKYFKLGNKSNKGFFKIKNNIKDLVEFKKLNLNQTKQYQIIDDDLDLIFCRNVFIYFNEITRNKILKNFYLQLKDDGYLFLGHSESIPNFSSKFPCWKLVYKTTYQKI